MSKPARNTQKAGRIFFYALVFVPLAYVLTVVPSIMFADRFSQLSAVVFAEGSSIHDSAQ